MSDPSNKNSLLHYLFANFSTIMELAVEICQELLKLSDTIQAGTTGDQRSKHALPMNQLNRKGLSPVDLAIEMKQN